jgi:N-methylhydantoinase B
MGATLYNVAVDVGGTFTLKNISHEMDRVLVNTAVSPVIREQAEEFPLIADRKGRMIVG